MQEEFRLFMHLKMTHSQKFHMRVSQNDDPINIEQIVEFALFVRQHDEIHKYMRKYAEKNLTWEIQMKKVMDTIKNL